MPSRSLVLAVMVLAAGCGGDSKDDLPAIVPAAEPAACAGPWTRVFVAGQGVLSLPMNLWWKAGKLYYGQTLPQALVVVGEDGRAKPSGLPYEWHQWMEDDATTVAKMITSNEPPWTVRYELHVHRDEGGPPSVTPFAFSGTDWDRYAALALTKDSIYGATSVGTRDHVRISRFDRVSGVEQATSTVSLGETGYVERLFVWRDWLFVLGPQLSFPVSIAGGSPVFVKALPSRPVGVSTSTGQLLWSSHREQGRRFIPVIRASQIGSADPPRELGALLPDPSYLSQAWDDGASGWYLSVAEDLADGANHQSIWWLDPAGNARRLACDPFAGRRITAGAVSPAGLYFVARADDLDYDSEIIFVARP